MVENIPCVYELKYHIIENLDVLLAKSSSALYK